MKTYSSFRIISGLLIIAKIMNEKITKGNNETIK